MKMNLQEHRELHAQIADQRQCTTNVLLDYQHDGNRYVTSRTDWTIIRDGAIIRRGVWK
jgi:hypothetical protein